MKYIVVATSGRNRTEVLEVDRNAYVVAAPDDIDDDPTFDIMNAADDTRCAIIPLIEQLEWEDDS